MGDEIFQTIVLIALGYIIGSLRLMHKDLAKLRGRGES